MSAGTRLSSLTDGVPSPALAETREGTGQVLGAGGGEAGKPPALPPAGPPQPPQPLNLAAQEAPACPSPTQPHLFVPVWVAHGCWSPGSSHGQCSGGHRVLGGLTPWFCLWADRLAHTHVFTHSHTRTRTRTCTQDPAPEHRKPSAGPPAAAAGLSTWDAAQQRPLLQLLAQRRRRRPQDASGTGCSFGESPGFPRNPGSDVALGAECALSPAGRGQPCAPCVITWAEVAAWGPAPSATQHDRQSVPYVPGAPAWRGRCGHYSHRGPRAAPGPGLAPSAAPPAGGAACGSRGGGCLGTPFEVHAVLSRVLVCPQERRALERKMSEMEEEMKVWPAASPSSPTRTGQLRTGPSESRAVGAQRPRVGASSAAAGRLASPFGAAWASGRVLGLTGEPGCRPAPSQAMGVTHLPPGPSPGTLRDLSAPAA